jgi:hypothetical protein
MRFNSCLKLLSRQRVMSWYVAQKGSAPSAKRCVGNPIEGERDSVLKANTIPVGRRTLFALYRNGVRLGAECFPQANCGRACRSA